MIKHFTSLPPQLINWREVVLKEWNGYFARQWFINIFEKFVDEVSDDRLFHAIDMALRYWMARTIMCPNWRIAWWMNRILEWEEYVIVQPKKYQWYFYDPEIWYYAYVSCMPAKLK